VSHNSHLGLETDALYCQKKMGQGRLLKGGQSGRPVEELTVSEEAWGRRDRIMGVSTSVPGRVLRDVS